MICLSTPAAGILPSRETEPPWELFHLSSILIMKNLKSNESDLSLMVTRNNEASENYKVNVQFFKIKFPKLTNVSVPWASSFWQNCVFEYGYPSKTVSMCFEAETDVQVDKKSSFSTEIINRKTTENIKLFL